MSKSHELYNEAEALKEEGKDQEAIAKLNELLAQDDGFVLAHLALSVLYGKTGRHEDAIGHVQKACALEPDDPINFVARRVT